MCLRRVIFMAIFIFLGIALYSNTFRSSFHLDDINSIVVNQSIGNITDLKAIWDFWPTRFMTYASVAINYHFSKLNVFGYHLFNLTVHICSAILVWWFTLLTMSTPAMKEKKITNHSKYIAFFTGLVFLTHPIQTQGVTYIIQRAASLATLFYLLSLCLYIKSRLLQPEGKYSGIRKGVYVFSVIIAIIAMFTKEMAITLPFAILVYEFFLLKEDKKLDKKHLIPFFTALLVIPLTMTLTKSVNFREMHRVSEIPPGISPIQYFLTQFRVLLTYIRLLFFPLNQNLDYDYSISKNLLELPALISVIILTIILFVAFKLFKKQRLISFGVFWFFLTLLPESSIIPIKDVIYEHRLYLPMTGYALVLVSTIYLFSKGNKTALIVILSVIICCNSYLTYARNSVWKNEYTLWDDTIKKSPNKARPYNGRGLASYINGDIDQAIADYNRAIELDTDNADYYSNRGTAFLDKGNIDQAIADRRKAIKLDPKAAGTYNNLGNIFRQTGNFDQAIENYNKAVAIKPDYADAYNNRGIVYQTKKDIERAMSDYNKTIQISPNYTPAYLNRGNAYQDMGDFDKAIIEYDTAIKINPKFSEAYNNRGNAYVNKGVAEKAYLDYNSAIGLNPNYAEARYNRGNINLNMGRIDESITDYTRAIEINPNYAAAYNNRGNAYKLKGDADRAMADHKMASKINTAYSAM